jgi:hypothetical protein
MSNGRDNQSAIVGVLAALAAIVVIGGIGVWAYDGSQVMVWVGDCDLQIDFLIVDAESGNAIPNAEIRIRNDGGFYDDADEDTKRPFSLRTDADGMAHRTCRNNRCIGRQSRLEFTDTHVAYKPRWTLQIFAEGYSRSAAIDLADDEYGRPKHERPNLDRWEVRIALKKANR